MMAHRKGDKFNSMRLWECVERIVLGLRTHIIAKFSFFLLVIVLISPNLDADSLNLEGVWVLNRSLTIESIETNKVVLPRQVANILESSFDSLAYVFKGDKTTYTPKESIGTQVLWYTWRVKNVTSKLIEISLRGEQSSVIFVRNENCLGLKVQGYSYVEYYCREDDI